MKLIYDIDSKPCFTVEETINEETGQSEKRYKIKGVFSTIGQKNRNGRIYPMELWEAQVQKYQENLKNGSLNCLMEYQHPARTSVDPMKAVAKINKLFIKDNYVIGEATLLDNPEANQLKSLIDNGIKISVSSRGVGSIKNGIVESFNLITYDIVPDPSDYNATMNGLVESYQLNGGVVQDLEFDPEGNKIHSESTHQAMDEKSEEVTKKNLLTESEVLTGIESLFKVYLDQLTEGAEFKTYRTFSLKDNTITFHSDFKFTSRDLSTLYEDLNESKEFNLNDKLCLALKSYVKSGDQDGIILDKIKSLINGNTYTIN